MTVIHLDMSGARDYAPMAPGPHRLKVRAAKVGQSKSGGPKIDLQYNAVVRLDGTPVVRVDGTPGEKTIIHSHQSLGADSMWAIGNTLVSLGFNPDEVFSKETPFALDPDALVGREMEAEVTVYVYNERQQNGIGAHNPVGVEVAAGKK